MIQPRGDLDLFQEPLRPEGRGEIWAQHLESDLATMLPIPPEIDGRHPAPPQESTEFIAVGDRGGQIGGNVGCH